ncbi:hypothetical protein ACS0TY_034849 [Phlomoides rotata]
MPDDARTHVKQELPDPDLLPRRTFDPELLHPSSIVDLLSSDSDSDSSSSDDDSSNAKKKRKVTDKGVDGVLPVGFLDPLPSKQAPLPLTFSPTDEQLPLALPSPRVNTVSGVSARQFWKAGDYELPPSADWDSSNGGMDHVRVHPRFLHSNATSHKWVLGAFAELLDNSLDEFCNGATHVNIDMVKNKKDRSKMLMIEDNGGGMDPDKMRHCMSLGYSAKSKTVDTIGQYGNGFKTSTMRLGADVIVLSRCHGKTGGRSTQSIGLLSYTFLRDTGKEDIVVPMLDYERSGEGWKRITRSSATDWNQNVETMVQWSPFSSEDDLLQQFNQMQAQGTRIIIYNLWEDDEGLLELDFDTDPHDIQIRGVNRDEKNIDMAKKHPNSKHFLTYRHSLRSYAAILYLRLPPCFRIILRGQDVEHHNVVNDMMLSDKVAYRPQAEKDAEKDGNSNVTNMAAIVTIGFVKDAKAHIDVQGFNVYHKNRLIKPFWRVWHPPGSDGRGVIGVLEANFVEPAHDKQGFERTTVLSKLETKLVQLQKAYWTTNCHKIGYAPRRNKKEIYREASYQSPQLKKRNIFSSDKTQTKLGDKGNINGRMNGKGDDRTHRKKSNYTELSSSSGEDSNDDDRRNNTSRKQFNASSSSELFRKDGPQRSFGLRNRKGAENGLPARTTRNSNGQEKSFYQKEFSASHDTSSALAQLKEENLELRSKLKRKEEEILGDLLHDLQKEKEKSKSLEAQLQEAIQKCTEQSKEQDCLIEIFSEERQRRENDEEKLRKQLKEASNTIQQFLDKCRKCAFCKVV